MENKRDIQISKILLSLGKALSDEKLELQLYRCPDCQKFIAVPKITIEAFKENGYDFESFNLKCPFCECNNITKLERSENNEEYYESFEEDLGTIKAKPLVNLCHSCMFVFTCFRRNLKYVQRCPLCGEYYTEENSSHVSFERKITDSEFSKILESFEDEEIKEKYSPENFKNNEIENYVSLDCLTGQLVKIKFAFKSRPLLCYIFGFNPSLNMIIVGIPNKDSDDLKYFWYKTSDIENIEEC